MSDRFFVVCGTRQEFQEFITRKAGEMWIEGHTSVGMSNFVWVKDRNQLMGIRNPHGWFYGTWYDLPDLQDIMTQLIISTDGITAHLVDINLKAREIRKSKNELL